MGWIQEEIKLIQIKCCNNNISILIIKVFKLKLEQIPLPKSCNRTEVNKLLIQLDLVQMHFFKTTPILCKSKRMDNKINNYLTLLHTIKIFNKIANKNNKINPKYIKKKVFLN